MKKKLEERKGKKNGWGGGGKKGGKDSENTKGWRHVTVTCINGFIVYFDC